MVNISWKKVATGVIAAAVGAAAFGAVQYMFLAPNVTIPDVMGVPISVILPIVVGTIGFVGAFALSEKHKMAKDVVAYGSAALIGAGIMSYAGWISTPATTARARAASAARYIPPKSAPISALPSTSMTASANGGTVKLI